MPAVNGTVVEVTVDQGPEAAMASLRSLDQAGIVPTTFTLREPSLDDVFLALTGRRTEDETEHRGRTEPDADGHDGSRCDKSRAHRHGRVLMTTAVVAPTVAGAPHSDSIGRPGSAGPSRTR